MPEFPAIHPTDEEFAAYLGRSIAPDDRARFEAHVADCAQCRALLARSGATLASLWGERRGWARRLAPLLIGLAAAGIAVVLLRGPSPRVAPATAELRASPPAPPPVRLLEPAAGARVPAASLRFAWHGTPNAQLYELSIVAADGGQVWSTRTEDTTAALPRSVAAGLVTGRRYFWRVDALLPDTRSVSSGDTEFEVAVP